MLCQPKKHIATQFALISEVAIGLQKSRLCFVHENVRKICKGLRQNVACIAGCHRFLHERSCCDADGAKGYSSERCCPRSNLDAHYSGVVHCPYGKQTHSVVATDTCFLTCSLRLYSVFVNQIRQTSFGRKWLLSLVCISRSSLRQRPWFKLYVFGCATRSNRRLCAVRRLGLSNANNWDGTLT
jgi:hypothetical protein